jgi:predicted NodU family carbamoyl transferase
MGIQNTEKHELSRLQTEYDTRLKEANMDDPISFKDAVWSYWPKADLGQIFSFVLSRKGQDMEFVGHHKSQKAYSYYQSGFDDVIYFTSLNGTKVGTSRVSPSHTIRNEVHDVCGRSWVRAPVR